MIEQIYNCNTCRNYSKHIAKEDHEEVFSLAIEKIIVQKPQKVDNYQSYFYTVLKNTYLDYVKDSSKFVYDMDFEQEQEQENNYKIALKSFLEKQTDNIVYNFYQDLVYLSFENSKFSLAKKLKLRRADLDTYLKQAHKLIQNEYNRITNH